MTHKNWIYVKRGLSENPKHRRKMGECIWLYLRFIDRADWETGVVHGWQDVPEANAMGLSVVTLRYQRRKLGECGYITYRQTRHGQEIEITQWLDPRRYDSELINPREGGVNRLSPSPKRGVNKLTPAGLKSTKGVNHVVSPINTPTLYSKPLSANTSTVHPPQNKGVNLLTPLLAGFQTDFKHIIETMFLSDRQVPKLYRDILQTCSPAVYEEETGTLIVYAPGQRSDVLNDRFAKLISRHFQALHPGETKIKFVDEIEVDFG